MLEREGSGELEKDEEAFDDIYAYIRNAYDPEEPKQSISSPNQLLRESIKHRTFHMPSYYLLFTLLRRYIFYFFL